MDFYYYNLSNVLQKNEKVYFLLSRLNKNGKFNKQMQCHDLNSPTIQSLQKVLQVSINQLLDMSKYQDEQNPLNVGVFFKSSGIEWSQTANGYKQKYYGPYIYPQDWLDKWIGEEKRIKEPQYVKVQSFMGDESESSYSSSASSESFMGNEIVTENNCPCNRKLKMPFWDDENCIICKQRMNNYKKGINIYI